jgi:uncharacterized protein YicC (UPF0701 family)
MDQIEIEGLLKDLNTRTIRIEQKLPTLATKSDVHEEAERTHQHVNVMAEGMKDSIKRIADGHQALGDRLDGVSRDIRSVLDNHERRITTLEANTPKRRKRSSRN